MISTYSIKDLSQLSRIKAPTLRIWEQRYGIMNPQRTSTNIRFYSQDDLKYLLNVAILHDHGVKISNIAKLSVDEIGEKVKHLTHKTLSYSSQIQSLVLAMLELDEDRFEHQLNLDIEILGLEGTIENIIYPFLHQIGVLWQTNTINPAQEHFISNLIRQKLIASIDALKMVPKPGAKKIILFLPQGELHEISLLYAYYLIKLNGHKSIYLGQNLPLCDLLEVQKSQQADVILTVITSTPCAEDVQPYLNRLGSDHAETSIWVSGYQVVSQEITLKPNFVKMKDVSHLKLLLKI